MGNHLDLLLGAVLLASPALGISPCSSDGRIALYRSCNLTRVPPVPNSTERLLLSFNYIRAVTATSFPVLERLELLELGTQLTAFTVGRAAFRNLPNLRVLDLGHSRLDSLHPDAFQGLPRLFELRLFYCGLSEAVLRDGHFRNLPSLSRLDLSKNQIHSLSLPASFRELDALTSIDFSLNDVPVVCEWDLRPLRGKELSFLGLAATNLYYRVPVDWAACRNPLRDMVLGTLDVSQNGWGVDLVRNFTGAVNGTPIASLLLAWHVMGPGFGFQNIKDPDRSTFAGLARSSLRRLDLAHGSIFALGSRLFEGLGELRLLNLAHNKVNTIARQAFYGLDSLQVLNLSFNLLGELYNPSFDGLPGVAYIDLQRNHIGAVQDGTFRSLRSLQTLDLRDNALKTVGFVPSIPTLYLGGNKLATLPSAGFEASFVQLSGNRLERVDELYALFQIPQLQVLILNQNRLSLCAAPAAPRPVGSPSLEQLFLGENMLQLAWETGSCWDVFQGLAHLQRLFLNNNYLTFLPPGVFGHLVALRLLSLNGNLLAALAPGDLPPGLEVLDVSWNQLLSPDPAAFASLRFLDVTHNKFICECDLGPFVVWLNRTNVTLLGAPEDVSCSYPGPLAGAPLSSLSTEGCDEEERLAALRFSLFVLSTVAVALFLAAILAVAKLRGSCFLCYQAVRSRLLGDRARAGEPDHYKYDAYLCFSGKDFEWVQGALLARLDAQYSARNPLRLCFEERDFAPGESVLANIQAAVWSSRRVVCVVSRHFLRDGWCLEAFGCARSRCLADLRGGPGALIVVVVGALSQFQLRRHRAVRAFLQRQPYLRWPEDPQDVGWFLHKLSRLILKREEEKKKEEEEDNGDIPLQTITTVS
ncbi:toll-like receptor 5 isoform X2 [Pipistrellus kuhlii]|nr:toll-like receptor 5 [Pipistrellus kuhlii]XP_045443045.1 toll-like receptor 5 isoform X2 [Pipistrellus kuhlii]